MQLSTVVHMAIHSYAVTMPLPDTHTPHRMIRIPDLRWNRFGALVGLRDRSRVINEFVAWYNGEPGAKCPKPPKAEADSAH